MPAVDPLFLSFQLALAGRYSIDRELGRGGTGVVYLAREVHLDRFVAIKLLPPERAALPAARESFLREARLAAKLSHPNIIPIYAVDDAGEFVFFVMAFVDGVTLAERVRTRGPLTSTEGARVLREVAWALGHAHAAGLVHRDIKPDNILLESASGRVLVADFGIAAAVGDTGSDGVAGTPEFMSPEQVLGGAIDARSDLYGLGVTAYYALSGRLPFEGETATAVLAKQVTEAPPSLASLGIAIPRQLTLLVERCLAKEPDARPRSAEAVAEQLGAALEQRRELPVALRAFVKRNGRIDGSGTLLYGVALALASTGVSIFSTAGWGFATLVAGATTMPLAYLVRAARRLTLQGFKHPDIAPAFTAEIQQARDERAAERNWASERVGKRLATTVKISGTIYGLSSAALLATYTVGGDALEALVGSSPLPVVYGISGVIAVLSAIGYLTVEQRRRDVDTEFWGSVWKGRIGRLAFSLARRFLGNRSIQSAVTHRATELALGMAAEQLYDTLPAASRDALRELPVVLRRLQADAHALRVRHDELRDALNSAADADSSPEYTELNAERLAVHGRLGETIGAMEAIRLNLLRLHAGSASVESLTTHLGLAAEVSADVERLIAAHSEVERALRYPRSITPSPA